MSAEPPAAACPVCASGEAQPFFQQPQAPVHCNRLWDSREEALAAPCGEIRLCFCPRCGHVFNAAFDPARVEYDQGYENSLHFSPRFQEYARSLAVRLVSQNDLHDKNVIEIGCGKGEFLALLCELAGSRGLGFDPGYQPAPETERLGDRLRFIPDFYSKHYADEPADLICARHVLEHIAQPRVFLEQVRRAAGRSPSAAVYFEVPNVLYTLRDLGIWDIIYEHPNYFSPASLAYLFKACGFAVERVAEEYGGQFLGVDAHPGQQTRPNVADPAALDLLTRLTGAFADSHRGKVRLWQETLGRFSALGRRVAAWGAGSKGVTFLNTFPAPSPVEYIVDLNPRKHGKYVAGTGQQIVPPTYLQVYRPDAILIMNPLYQDEIRRSAGALGLSAEFLLV